MPGPPTPGMEEVLLGWRFVTGFAKEPSFVRVKTPAYYEAVAKLLFDIEQETSEAPVRPLSPRWCWAAGAAAGRARSGGDPYLAWEELKLGIRVVRQIPSGPHRKLRRWASKLASVGGRPLPPVESLRSP